MIKRLLESLNILANPPANKCRDIPWLTEHFIIEYILSGYYHHLVVYACYFSIDSPTLWRNTKLTNQDELQRIRISPMGKFLRLYMCMCWCVRARPNDIRKLLALADHSDDNIYICWGSRALLFMFLLLLMSVWEGGWFEESRCMQMMINYCRPSLSISDTVLSGLFIVYTRCSSLQTPRHFPSTLYFLYYMHDLILVLRAISEWGDYGFPFMIW